MYKSSGAKKLKKSETIHCKGINKNKTACKYHAKETVYCKKHVHLALDSIVKIQNWWKKTFSRLFIKRRGYAFYSRFICNNQEDFYTLNNILDIPECYFISYYETETKKIWAFDIRSIFSLFSISNFVNPYTTIQFSPTFIHNANFFISKFKNNSDFNLNNEIQDPITHEERISRKCIDCFIEINSLGYYCNHLWILQLSKNKLIKLFFEFKDIIYYRAFLNKNQVQSIFGCPFPFSELIYGIESKSHSDLVELIVSKLKMILQNQNNKELGILLFLTALTSVSQEANMSLSFLQQANL